MTTMKSNLQFFRWLTSRLPAPGEPRLVVLTGARQTGKTTLARSVWSGLRYVNLDAIEDREALRAVPTAAWDSVVGDAVLDEAQKEPTVFEKVKWAFDAGRVRFSALLGSSRLLLLHRIRETLAGRAFLYDLWPLMASELRHATTEAPPRPLLHGLLTGETSFAEQLGGQPPRLLAEEEATRTEAIAHLARWGGMPALLPLDDDQRRDWLRSYQQTFLERDLADLVRMVDLQPFRTLQRVAMLRAGGLLSYSELARDAGVAATTARRYLEYLRLTYQVVLLPPFSRNLTSSVVKSPKLYWPDLGLLRHATQQWGELDGPLFETLAIAEIHKLVMTLGLDARLSFYRTRSGREADLLVETPLGVIGMEVKKRPEASPADVSALRALRAQLGPAWRGGLVITDGGELLPLVVQDGIWAVPLHRLV